MQTKNIRNCYKRDNLSFHINKYRLNAERNCYAPILDVLYITYFI